MEEEKNGSDLIYREKGVSPISLPVYNMKNTSIHPALAISLGSKVKFWSCIASGRVLLASSVCAMDGVRKRLKLVKQ